MRIRILDCATIVGKSPKRFDGVKTYVSTGAVACDGIDYTQTEQVTYSGRPSRANLTAQKKDVLFAKMCETQKTLLLDETTSGYIYSTGFFAVRANREKITPECLYYLVSSGQFLKQKDKFCSGATQKAITNAGLQKITVNLPDLKKQDEIVTVLDKIGQLIKLRKSQLEKLDLLIKSKFAEMFENKGFDKKEIRKFVDCNIKSVKKQYLKTDIINYIDISSIDNKNNTIVSFTKYVVQDAPSRAQQCLQKNDILISTVRPNLKNIAINKFDDNNMVGSSGFCILRPISCHYFLFYSILTDEFTKTMVDLATGASYPAIKNEDVLSFNILNPPVELQNRFGKFVERIETVKAAIRQGLEKFEFLKESLMQKYFG